MKRRAFLAIMIVVSLHSLNAQSMRNNVEKVKSADKLVFYGYDFSHLRLVDEKRKGQDMSKFPDVWQKFLYEYITREGMAKKLRKTTVEFSSSYMTKVNNSIRFDSMWSAKPRAIPSSEIQSIITNYEVDRSEGLGLAVILECMNENTKKTSMYFTFFDIATKEVLWAEYVNSFDGNSYNRVQDWAMGIFAAYKSRFLPAYKKG